MSGEREETKGKDPSGVGRSLGVELDGAHRPTLMMGSRYAPSLGQYATLQVGCCGSEDVSTGDAIVWAENALRGTLPVSRYDGGSVQGLEE